jgi:NitT/TauT family transport system permease protein
MDRGFFILKAQSQFRVQTRMNSRKKPTLSQRLAGQSSWLAVLSLGLVILIWGLVVQWGKPPSFILPAPAAVWQRFVQVLTDGTLLTNTLVTLSEVLLGLLIGSLLATVTGYGLAKSHSLEKILSPFLVASQAVPTVAIAPLLVIWFGPGMISKVVICGLTVFFPILVNTVIGIQAVPESLHDLMKSMRATRVQTLRYLEIPAALPVLFGGLRIGATLSVIGAVVGEFVGSDRGLGFLINVGRGQFDTSLVFVALFMLILLAVMLYGAAYLAERRVLRWKPGNNH